MEAHMLLVVLVCCLAWLQQPGEGAKKKAKQGDLIRNVDDIKDFKKLIRTRNNVLVIFVKKDSDVAQNMDIFTMVADQIRGQATLARVNCYDAKKLCKKLKVSPDTYKLKHYKDGEFNKDYDRKTTVKSMVRFLKDPTGDIPWEEDTSAGDVVHLDTQQQLQKLLRKEKRPILIMFYAPWCGFCKKIKPDYASAATELKGHSVLAGMDVDRSENMEVRMLFNITGFPTILYFERGQLQYKYGGANDKDGIITWMKNPNPPKEEVKEPQWADEESDVAHLTDESFDDYIATNPSVLIMFYAPWCGHCKKMKPEYTQAAEKMKEEGIEGKLAAVDATQHRKVAERFKVKGFPSVKYFKDGNLEFDFNERTLDKIIEFMKDPKEPPPPPPPEPSWEDMPSEVNHLSDETYKSFLKKKKHTLVMFYAPWCGHCKKAKPEFMAAAEKFKEDSKVVFAAVDCTKNSPTCQTEDVSGYPTFVYFNYGKNSQKYTGGREEPDFLKFMKDPLNPGAAEAPAPPGPEEQWAEITGQENVNHLTSSTFDDFMDQQNSALVMFYAPWCGHCKAMKPDYAEAATIMKEKNIAGALATVDVTAESALGERFQVKAFPTIKYFKNGKEEFQYERARKAKDFVSFMENPVSGKEPEKEPEAKWSDEAKTISHLDDSSFNLWLGSDKIHALVMFYAPWCGHCKKAKPDYAAAADELVADKTRYLAAVDCTAAGDVCKQQGVTGYPTFHYYRQGEFVSKYSGARSKQAFLDFFSEQQKQAAKQEEQAAKQEKQPPKQEEQPPKQPPKQEQEQKAKAKTKKEEL
ncbi:Protein disulfide-isomerase A5 [Lamellibrachia satsuma]|nr:Protein disulfide-isomerase A5 [Lamellibrachia satsuma]